MMSNFSTARWRVIEIDTSIIIGQNNAKFSIRLPMKNEAWAGFPKGFLKESGKPNRKKLCIPVENYVRINFVDSDRHIYKSSDEFAKMFERGGE